MAKAKKVNKSKNHKWAAKRFKITKKWKVVFFKTCNNHLLTNKGKNHKDYKAGKVLAVPEVKNIKLLISH